MTNINVRQLYDKIIQLEKIPCTAEENVWTPDRHLIVRRPYVDLVELYREPHFRKAPLSVSVHVDTLHIPRTVVFQDHFLRITARHINASDNAGLVLDHRQNDRAGLQCFALKFSKNLTGGCIQSSGASEGFDIQPKDNAIGFEISSKGGQLFTKSHEKIPKALLQELGPFPRSLVTSFQLAACLATEQPELAIHMLRWVVVSTRDSEYHWYLGEQSQALLLQIASKVEGFQLVPSLSPRIYKTQAEAFRKAAEKFHNEYKRLKDRAINIGTQKEILEMDRERQQDTISYVNELISLRHEDAKRTLKASQLAEGRVRSQHHILAMEKIDFEAELEQWHAEQILNAAVKGSIAAATAVIKIAVQLPAIFAGNPAPLLATAGDVAKGLTEIVEASIKVPMEALLKSKIEEEKKERKNAKVAALKAAGEAAFEGGKGIANAISQIVSSCQTAQTAANIANQLLVNAQHPPEDIFLSGESRETLESVTGGSEGWEILNKEFHLALQPLVDQKLPGAFKYQTELEKLIIYGKAICECRLAYAQAVAEYGRQKLQKDYEQRHSERIKKYIDQGEEAIEQSKAIQQGMYQRYLGVKTNVFSAVDNYCRAYLYWALQDSPIKAEATFSSTIPELCTQLAKIAEDKGRALESFVRRPQIFEDNIIRVEDASVIDSLQKTRVANWTVDLDHPTFKDYERVRMDSIQVRLVGVPDDKKVAIDLTTSGRFRDKGFGKDYFFVGRPVKWLLKYQNGKDLTKGKLPESMEGDYFMPTPFTDWTLIVSQEKNPDLDLSNLTAIELKVSGNFIAKGNV